MNYSIRLSVLLFLGTLCSTPGSSQTKTEAFPLSSVRLLESPFKKAQETDKQYILSLSADRLLAPFLREAGIEPNEKSYGNWENTGLDGHIGGHYLSALADMYAATGDPRVGERLTYMVNWLEKCQQQDKDGYVGGIPGGKKMWQDVAGGKINANNFGLNDKWVPLYNIHKLYAGLIDAYTVAGNQKAKTILVKLADWFLGVTASLTDAQLQAILQSEHGGLNEAFADIAMITGDQKYLQLARRLSHRTVLEPLLQHRDALNGLHANTQIPKIIGTMRIANITGDTALAGAANFFWNTVTQNRTVSFGGNSVREHFHPATDFSSMIETKEGPETCNTYNMLKLSKQLFLAHPSAGYMDYYERAVYNHILSSQHPEGGFVYFTPIRPRHYRVYSQAQEGMWCCVGSGLENHGKYGEMIYAHQDNDVFVNLFIPSVLQWKEKGLVLEQQTRFPEEEKTAIKLTLPTSKEFTLYVRYPSWIPDGRLTATVNKKVVPVTRDANGYAALRRTWKSGDVVLLNLPMETKAEFLPDSSPWMSFVRGPIVLAAATDTTDLVGLRADDSRMGHVANGPLYPIEEAPLIVASNKKEATNLQAVKGRPLTFTAPGLIYPARYQNLKLVPFYTVHDARYMLYWRYATPAQLETIKEELRKAEAARLALDAITVDQVAPGEQQPESDHQFGGGRTRNGVFKDRHWRATSEWFSYVLKNKKGAAKKLRITYYGKDKNEGFDIYLNNRLLQKVTLDGSGAEEFIDVDYDIPADLRSGAENETLTLKFSALPGSNTARIFSVRLLSK